MSQIKKSNVLQMCILFVIMSALIFGSPLQKINKKKLELKPDLIISKMVITKTGTTMLGGHKVQIAVTVQNRIRRSCAKNFKVKLEWTENPTAGYTYLNQGGVASLCNSPSSIGLASKTLYFTDTIKAGKFKKYRATADPKPFRVSELDESNNQETAGYTVPKWTPPPARATSALSTIGIDLVFKSVEVWKQSGFTYIRPTIKNIRSGACTGGTLVFKIIGVTEQSFSSSFGGNETFTLTGLGFADDLTSCTITLELSGACHEVFTTGNEKTVPLTGLSSTKKTITF